MFPWAHGLPCDPPILGDRRALIVVRVLVAVVVAADHEAKVAARAGRAEVDGEGARTLAAVL